MGLRRADDHEVGLLRLVALTVQARRELGLHGATGPALGDIGLLENQRRACASRASRAIFSLFGLPAKTPATTIREPAAYADGWEEAAHDHANRLCGRLLQLQGVRQGVRREAGAPRRAPLSARGVRGTSRDLVELAGDVTGASVLEVGGGVGAIELELLAAGAERATDVELSGEYEEEALKLRPSGA